MFPLQTSFVIKSEAWIREKRDGKLISENYATNVITINGRDMAMERILGLSANPIVALAIGASGTAASPNDTHLTYELIGQSPRIPLTNLSGNPLSSADFVSETVPDGDLFFYRKITIVGTSSADDGNTNQPIQEIGLVNSSTLPVNPTATSGTLFNHIVFPFPTIKTPGSDLEYQVTIRF